MSFLLDTNVCIAFLNGRDDGVRDKLLALDPESVSLCSIVKAELYCGARNSQQVEGNLDRLRRFFEPFPSLPFADAEAEQYGVLRAQLRREGRPIAPNDLMIAATALANDLTLLTLVSRNQNEFQRIPGLRMVGW
jgi:tRNA(fMet)-specific endonuclease VapC